MNNSFNLKTICLISSLLGFGKRVRLEFNSFHRYILQADYQNDYGFFKAGEMLIFLGSGFIPYDGCKVFEFFDIKGGACRQFRLFDGEQSDQLTKQIKSAFLDLGPDMAKGSFFPENGPTDSNYKSLNEHLEYFKDLVEGKEPIKSWFVWLQENSELLHKNLTRADQLRFKCSGYNAIKDVLGVFGISFQESPRYKYIGMHVKYSIEKSPPSPIP